MRKIICWEKRQDIEVAVRNLSGAEPGTANYMASYSKGLEQVMKEMDPPELTQMEELREKWATASYPTEIQRR